MDTEKNKDRRDRSEYEEKTQPEGPLKLGVFVDFVKTLDEETRIVFFNTPKHLDTYRAAIPLDLGTTAEIVFREGHGDIVLRLIEMRDSSSSEAVTTIVRGYEGCFLLYQGLQAALNQAGPPPKDDEMCEAEAMRRLATMIIKATQVKPSVRDEVVRFVEQLRDDIGEMLKEKPKKKDVH